MTNFKQRKRAGDEFETLVQAKLTEMGWIVQPFGKTAFSRAFRNALKDIEPDAPERWMPDFLIVKENRIIVVDAKGGDRWKTSQNHDVEDASVKCMERYCTAFGREGIFIFSDWSCCTWQKTRAGEFKPENRDGRYKGSGTAFWVLKNRLTFCKPLDVFLGIE